MIHYRPLGITIRLCDCLITFFKISLDLQNRMQLWFVFCFGLHMFWASSSLALPNEPPVVRPHHNIDHAELWEYLRQHSQTPRYKRYDLPPSLRKAGFYVTWFGEPRFPNERVRGDFETCKLLLVRKSLSRFATWFQYANW